MVNRVHYHSWLVSAVLAISILMIPQIAGAYFLADESPTGKTIVQDSLLAEAREAMQRSTQFLQSISTHGGYAGIYSADLSARYGEAKYDSATSAEIWIQPPGTPTVGESFLRAYRITGKALYLEAARQAGRSLAWGQHDTGGWAHAADLSHVDDPTEPIRRQEGGGTFDDETTQGALIFLMELDREIDREWLTETIERGLQFILNSQFDNGAWPQWYPLDGGYSDYYTYNDSAINDCIRVLLKAHALYGDERYLTGAERGGEFIIRSQISQTQAGWAQQYNHEMQPARARSFEPAGVCSAVTARNIRTLTQLYLYTGNRRYLHPTPAAIDWLERSKIGDNQWSRLYELETNRPIYGDRGGELHYDLMEISEERRQGYSWQNGFGVTSAVSYYLQAIVNPDGAGFEPADASTLSGELSAESAAELEEATRRVLVALDENGRWLEDEEIRVSVFVENFNVLCAFVARHSGED
jgi:hypothetical protein